MKYLLYFFHIVNCFYLFIVLFSNPSIISLIFVFLNLVCFYLLYLDKKIFIVLLIYLLDVLRLSYNEVVLFDLNIGVFFNFSFSINGIGFGVNLISMFAIVLVSLLYFKKENILEIDEVETPKEFSQNQLLYDRLNEKDDKELIKITQGGYREEYVDIAQTILQLRNTSSETEE